MAEQSIIFDYKGKDKQGKIVTGQISNKSAQGAKADLRAQGILVTKLKPKRAPLFAFGAKISGMDIAIFVRQLSTMLKAGVPLVQAFKVVSDSLEKPALKQLIISINEDVSSGTSFAHSLRKHPHVFDDLFCNLVDAGEQSGALESMLDRIATYQEKIEETRSKIKKALVYPISVLVVALLVTVILLVKVVPQFEQVFKSFGADLPAFTKLVVNLSEFMQSYWLFIFLSIGGAVFFLKTLLAKSQNARDTRDALMLKTPIISNVLEKAVVARFSRTLSTTFAAGVPLVTALESVAGAANNAVFNKAILIIRDDVAAGQQLNFAMKSSNLFPPLVIQMVAIGEESGSLEDMLGKSATHYESEVDDAVDHLISLMEPFIMCILAVLVGGLIIAMYLPIFNVGSAIGG